jgi:hypothetical protein
MPMQHCTTFEAGTSYTILGPQTEMKVKEIEKFGNLLHVCRH